MRIIPLLAATGFVVAGFAGPALAQSGPNLPSGTSGVDQGAVVPPGTSGIDQTRRRPAVSGGISGNVEGNVEGNVGGGVEGTGSTAPRAPGVGGTGIRGGVGGGG